MHDHRQQTYITDHLHHHGGQLQLEYSYIDSTLVVYVYKIKLFYWGQLKLTIVNNSMVVVVVVVWWRMYVRTYARTHALW